MANVRSLAVFGGFVLLCFAVAGFGGWATSTSVSTWYQTLEKPAWTPPGSVIGLVWNVLYASMAVAAWLVWRRRADKPLALAMTCFGSQLALNLLWSVCFFLLRSPGLALLEICVLWVAVALTLLMFWRVSTAAGLLFVPYLAWVSFAGFLNATVWKMN